MALLAPRKRKGQTGETLPPVPALDDRIIRLDEVMHRAGIKRATIYKHIADGRFPAPRKIGSASGWKLSEINAWVSGTWTPAQEASK